MSELKAYKMVNEMYCTDVRVIPAEVYFKSEADKVIAELKKERDWLAKDRAQAYDDLEKRAQLNIKQNEEIAKLKQEIERLKEENEMTIVGVNLRSPTSDGRFI